ncbi:restriction endonuclease [Enterococcus sp. HY326]|uniref:restriction endonuclease n=1 Tax=Enterococcus sp. HY326 TaxID=2971265 RepID=UPI00223F2327|nr:restriction endonuclease [Enterococcus sp. HY326]
MKNLGNFVGAIAVYCGLIFFLQKDQRYLYGLLLCLLLWLVLNLYPIFSQKHRFARAELVIIDEMSGIEFEQYTKFLLTKVGYLKIKETSRIGDQGIDLLAQKDGVSYGFQCKRWKKKVGNKAVQEVHAGLGYYGLDQGIVITNNYFTKSASELAAKLNVRLWARDDLAKILREQQKLQAVKEKKAS